MGPSTERRTGVGDLDGLGYDRATVEVTSCASGMGAAIAEKPGRSC